MERITLTQLSQLVKLVLQETIKPDVWVIAEISSCKMAGRGGHYYLDLVDKSQNTITAKMSAAIWANTYAYLRSKFGADLNNLLKDGNKILLRCTVDFHEVYGIKLIVSDIDASVTLGELELRRQQTINRLTQEGFIGLNAQLPLPQVLQRIAVISSATAAGYGDFINQTTQNPYQYKVQTTLFPSLMQGEGVEQDLIARLQEIAERQHRFDAVVIIRGGGSKLDLEAFNNYQIAVAIAQCPLPVLTGIGHQQDESVADLVAHTPLKTPTAVAEFVLQSFLNFEAQLLNQFSQLKTLTHTLLTEQHFYLHTTASQLKNIANNRLSHQNQLLQNIMPQMTKNAKHLLQIHQTKLQHLEQTFNLFNIDSLLQRGFTITRQNGKALTGAQKALKGQPIVTQFKDGQLTSIVQ